MITKILLTTIAVGGAIYLLTRDRDKKVLKNKWAEEETPYDIRTLFQILEKVDDVKEAIN